MKIEGQSDNSSQQEITSKEENSQLNATRVGLRSLALWKFQGDADTATVDWDLTAKGRHGGIFREVFGVAVGG